MYVNCPYCKALISTDPVTDLPPAFCPHCDSLLRREDESDAAPAQSSPFNYAVADWLIVPDFDKPHEEPRDDQTSQAAIADDSAFTEADARALLEADAETNPSALSPSPDAEEAVAETTADNVEGDAADAISVTATAAPLRAPKLTPNFLRNTRPLTAHLRAHGPRIAVVGLGILLVMQLLLADRARLARDPNWRPVIQTVCAALACRLPPWHEPQAFTLLQRDVREHPSIPGALRVSATFRNDARWPQAWPQLQLTLSDVEGRAVGMRHFLSREYLGGTPEQQELASGETVTIAMDIVEPTPRIVAYDFKFH